MNRKIIYVCFGRLTDKMARDWYIDYLIEKGAAVEYWDIVSLVREEHVERGEQNPGYLHVLRTFGEVEALLRRPENRDALYLMLITYIARFTRIYRLFSKYDCRMLTFAWGALPHDSVYKWRKIAAWLSTPYLFAKEIFNRSRAIAARKLKLVKPFEIAFVAGDALMAGDNHALKVVPVNYFDYDHYVKEKADGEQRLVADPYAVFLDINLPYHSDLEFCGRPQIEPARYYRSLNRFFGLLELEYGIKVVIAAHPRADYDTTTFEGRQTLRLVTAKLVKDAEFVLSHTSTAMSYAVLNAKPLMFIYTDAMAVAYQRSFMREMRTYADFLDAPIYNIDAVSGAARTAVRQVNLKRYERYKYDFLTSRQSENTSTQEIFWREINALCIDAPAARAWALGASRPR
jgi:hypothetical protein